MEAPALDRTPLKSCAGKGRERKAIRKVGDSDNGGDGIESTCSLPGLLNPGGSVEEGRVARGVGLPCPGIGPPLPCSALPGLAVGSPTAAAANSHSRN